MNTPGRWRMLPTAANRQPAVAAYVRGAGDTAFRPFALVVLRPEAGLLAAIDVFEVPSLFAAFGLPPSLDQ
jgi:RNA polymerase sigma-70 factor (ECF subfamily)